MRSTKKPVFFIVFAVILLLGFLTIFGIHYPYGDSETTIIKGIDEIRWGIDIQGGVNATFEPQGDYDASKKEMEAAKAVIQQRLLNLNITDTEVYVDNTKDRVIVSFPWQAGESDFDPEAAVSELGETAILSFRKGKTIDGDLILTGTDVDNADAVQQPNSDGVYEWVVSLKFKKSGTEAFSKATTELANASEQGYISIWMDEESISAPTVSKAITEDSCIISGSFTYESAKSLADKINAGSLPFKLSATSTNTISPTLGVGARNAMAVAGIIAFLLVVIFVIAIYRLPGVVAAIALLGQVIVSLAAVSGFFGNIDSFTLTIPGIAGIILSIGMGVDANVITAERIKEELRSGKTLRGSIALGYKRAWSAVFDGNITVIIVAVILMAAFGPTDSFFATLFKPVFFAFGASTAGAIYSLGYTLLIGIILNFIFGIFASRIMLTSLSSFKCFRNPKLYGGLGEGEVAKEPRKPLKVYENRKKFYATSLTLFVIFAVFAVVGGINLALEFKGGTLITYTYEGTVDTADIEKTVKESIGENATVKIGEDFATKEKTIELSFTSDKGLTGEIQNTLKQDLIKSMPDNNIESLESTDVSPTNGKEFFLKCIVAIVVASILMIIYVAFRFRKIGGLSAGVMAVLALLHDMIMVFGCFIICGFDIDANFIAVVLTILGYSLNATIIIYDRIRENRRYLGRKAPIDELVNLSVTQTIGRSTNTTITTVMAMVTVCVVCLALGVTSILSFAFPLIIGMIAGVYSSNCIAPTLWVMWQKHVEKRDKAAHKRKK